MMRTYRIPGLSKARAACAATLLFTACSAFAWAPIWLKGIDFEGYTTQPGQVAITDSVLGWGTPSRVSGSSMQVGVWYPSATAYSYSSDSPYGSLNAAPIGARGPTMMFMSQTKAGDAVQHTLPTLAGGKIHRVTVALGSRLQQAANFSGARIAIVNGSSQTLGSLDVTSLPQAGVLQDVAFDVDLGSSGCTNCSLVISSLGQVASGGYIDIDNVRVDRLDGSGSADASSMTIDLPMAQQVVQRRPIANSTRYSFSVPVLGHVWGSARVAGATVSATLLNADNSTVAGVTANQPMAFDAATGLYSGRLTGTLDKGGNYTVALRLTLPASAGGGTRTRNVANLGVGDVYLVAGQSNSAAFGSWGSTQYAATNTQARVADASGGLWKPMISDPIPSISGYFGNGGSAWPRFGELASQRAGVPIGLMAVGYGGSSASQWTPGADFNELNLSYAVRMLESSGIKAVLWHQGETDSLNGVSYATYVDWMTAVINGFRRKAGSNVPWYVAEVSSHPSTTMSRRGPIAAAQRQLTRTVAAVYPGASTDYLGDSRYTVDDVHFNATGLEKHARQWSDILTPGAPNAPTFNNADFGDVAISTGSKVTLTASASRVPALNGWYAVNGSDTGLAESGEFGVWVPTSAYYVTDHLDGNGRPVPMGAGNANIGYLASVPSGTALYQTLNLVGRPGYSYYVNVRLGRRINADSSFAGVRLILSLGGRQVATRTLTVNDLTDGPGYFSPIFVTYSVPSTATIGQKLALRVEVVNGASGTYVDLDGVEAYEIQP